MTTWLWVLGVSVALGGMSIWMCFGSKTWWDRGPR